MELTVEHSMNHLMTFWRNIVLVFVLSMTLQSHIQVVAQYVQVFYVENSVIASTGTFVIVNPG